MAQCSSHQKLHRSLIAGLSWKEEVEALSKQPLAAMHIPDALSYNRDQFHRIGWQNHVLRVLDPTAAHQHRRRRRRHTHLRRHLHCIITNTTAATIINIKKHRLELWTIAEHRHHRHRHHHGHRSITFSFIILVIASESSPTPWKPTWSTWAMLVVFCHNNWYRALNNNCGSTSLSSFDQHIAGLLRHPFACLYCSHHHQRINIIIIIIISIIIIIIMVLVVTLMITAHVACSSTRICWSFANRANNYDAKEPS